MIIHPCKGSCQESKSCFYFYSRLYSWSHFHFEDLVSFHVDCQTRCWSLKKDTLVLDTPSLTLSTVVSGYFIRSGKVSSSADITILHLRKRLNKHACSREIITTLFLYLFPIFPCIYSRQWLSGFPFRVHVRQQVSVLSVHECVSLSFRPLMNIINEPNEDLQQINFRNVSLQNKVYPNFFS